MTLNPDRTPRGCARPPAAATRRISRRSRALDGADEDERAALAGPCRHRACSTRRADAPGLLCAGRIGQTQARGGDAGAGGHGTQARIWRAPRRDDAGRDRAAAGRDATWRAAFVELLAEQYWWGEHLAWPVCHALVRLDGDAPLSAAYLRCFVRQVSAVGADGQLDADHGKLMAAHLQASRWIGREFWALFRVEGMGADYQLVERTGPAWDAAVLALCQEEPAFRERLLVESRKRCCEIFQRRASPGTCACIAWPIRPRTSRRQPARVSRRAGHGASTAVGLAQDMLKRAVGLLDADAMIDAGAAVLTRAEEAGQGPAGAVRRAQDRCRAAQPPFADRRRGAGRHAAGPRAAGAQAGGLVGRDAAGRHGWRDGRAGRGAAQAVTIPPPRREPLPDLPDYARHRR